MKRKKMMSLLLSAVAAVSMIAGCGNQAAGTSGEGNEPGGGDGCRCSRRNGRKTDYQHHVYRYLWLGDGKCGLRRRAEGGRGLYGCQCGFQLGSQRFL